MNDILTLEVRDHIGFLTLNDPERRNAISDSMIEKIIAACTAINDDPDVRCVVISGAGKNFCAGGDIRDMKALIDTPNLPPGRIRDNYLKGIQRIPFAIRSIQVPTIAAVHGFAIGAGCDLTLMCDIRIASTSAVFAESFATIGLIPGDGGAWLLPRVVGMARACEMTFTCERIDALTAERYGLVSRVVPDDALIDQATQLASSIASRPGDTIRMAKALLAESMNVSLAQSLDAAASMQAIAASSPNHREAVNAFLEKRQPVFMD